MAQPVVKFHIEGAAEVTARLKALEDLARSRLMRSALRKAANVVRDAAKDRAKRIDDPQTANDIAANIVTRYDGQESRKTGDIVMLVGVLGGSGWDGNKGPSKAQRLKAPGGSTWYWVYEEFGTKYKAAQPFMRPALSENVDLATATFIRALDKGVDRALKKQRAG